MGAEAALIFVQLFVFAFNTLVVTRVIMGYFADESNALYRFLVGITEPVLGPVRRILPTVPGLDLSPLATVLAIQVLGSVIERAITGGGS